MAEEHKFGTMNIDQNRATWGYFIRFWKSLFIFLAVVLLFLAFVGT